jgi:hypothetical protein
MHARCAALGLALALALAPLLASCSTSAEDRDPEDRGNIVLSLVGESLESSQPGEYSSGTGSSDDPLLVVARDGRAAALRAHQSGTGPAALLVADGTTDESAALEVRSRGPGPSARVTGGDMVIGESGTLTLASIARLPADDRVAPTAASAVIVIERRAGAQRNAIAPPDGREGAMLWVVNDDDDPAWLDETTIPAGSAQVFLLVGGRHRAAGGAPPTSGGTAEVPAR